MLQDIRPHVYNNEFKPREATGTDLVFYFHNNKVFLMDHEEKPWVPDYETFCKLVPDKTDRITYLFTVDEAAVFLYQPEDDRDHEPDEELFPERCFYAQNVFRTYKPGWMGFAGITAGHLFRWYRRNRFCGCCGKPMVPSKTERAMTCPACGFIDYPKICPAVIVAVTNGDKIMMTRYANRSFKKYALIAGFCEIGETLEDTVHREVMEEVGVKVKNLRYFASQPWGFSESLLSGFFAELDGDESVTMDEGELAEAAWFTRDEIPDDEENSLSLTYTMMKAFKETNTDTEV